jgi:hypothetical protein
MIAEMYKWPLRPAMELASNRPPAPIRYHATAMQLVAYLDGRYVEMHILTSTGRTIEIVCERDSIFSVQRHIEDIGLACPEISSWKTTQDADRSARK